MLFLACAYLFLPTPSDSRTILVNDFEELRSACLNARPGDTIVLAPGTYTIGGYSSLRVRKRPGPITVKGATGNPADVIIEGAGIDDTSVSHVFNLDDSPRWTFQDFTTRNTYYFGFKFDHGSTDCIIRNVVMRDHGSAGIKGTSDPDAGTYPDRLLVESCDIAFNKPSGSSREAVEGIDGVGVNDWVIRKNRFVNIQKHGGDGIAYALFTKGNSSNTIIEANYFESCFIAISLGGGGTGEKFFRDFGDIYEHSNGMIRNNVVVGSKDAGIYVNKGIDTKIYNNTLFECELNIELRFPESSGLVRNNLVKLRPSNPRTPLVRLRDGATLLANESNRLAHSTDFEETLSSSGHINLRLKAGSSAIDTGVDLTEDVPSDFDGVSRPQNSKFDVGAYEFIQEKASRSSSK
jgi:parallel beta-helix repeat protein